MRMAITGTGTEQDPFIVHSYDEIVEAVTSHYGTGNTPYYSQLANDIDCNDYGVDWEWETIELASNASGKTHSDILDLNGHTIKNVYIANSNYLFRGVNTSYPAEVKNGKLLNIFGNSPNGIFSTAVDVTNISASMEIAHAGSHLISACNVHNCALYAIILDINSQSFIYYGSNSAIKNVDIYLEAYGCTGSQALRPSGTFSCDSVRLIGKAAPANVSSPQDFRFCANKMYNSVIDFDMSAFVYPEGTTGTQSIVGGNGDNTTVINKSKINVSGYSRYTIPTGYLQATTEQMTVGSDLRSLGFLVVNVEE